MFFFFFMKCEKSKVFKKGTCDYVLTYIEFLMYCKLLIFGQKSTTNLATQEKARAHVHTGERGVEDVNECIRPSRARATDKARGKSAVRRLVHSLTLRSLSRARTRQREGRGRERAGTKPVNDDWTEKRRIGPERSVHVARFLASFGSGFLAPFRERSF